MKLKIRLFNLQISPTSGQSTDIIRQLFLLLFYDQISNIFKNDMSNNCTTLNSYIPIVQYIVLKDHLYLIFFFN